MDNLQVGKPGVTVPRSDLSALVEVVEVIRGTPLQDLGEVLGACMKSIQGYRYENNGWVPREVFELVLGIGGQYNCIETVVRVADPDGESFRYLLKQRGGDEAGWLGQFHIPGVALVPTPGRDMFASAHSRLRDEFDFISAERWEELRHRLERIGDEVHDEPERNSVCVTMVHCLTLSAKEYAEFKPVMSSNWRLFTVADLENVVDHHQRTLGWVSRPDRMPFETVDLRSLQ